MKRRDFTKIAGLGALAIQSFPAFVLNEILNGSQPGTSGIPLGLCNHSLRSMWLNVWQLIEYAIGQKLDSVLLNTFQPFESLDAAHLSQLGKIAKTNDISIYIGAGSISEKSTKFDTSYNSPEQ